MTTWNGRNWSMYSKVIKDRKMGVYAQGPAARSKNIQFFFVSPKMAAFPFLSQCESNARESELPTLVITVADWGSLWSV